MHICSAATIEFKIKETFFQNMSESQSNSREYLDYNVEERNTHFFNWMEPMYKEIILTLLRVYHA